MQHVVRNTTNATSWLPRKGKTSKNHKGFSGSRATWVFGLLNKIYSKPETDPLFPHRRFLKRSATRFIRGAEAWAFDASPTKLPEGNVSVMSVILVRIRSGGGGGWGPCTGPQPSPRHVQTYSMSRALSPRHSLCRALSTPAPTHSNMFTTKHGKREVGIFDWNTSLLLN